MVAGAAARGPKSGSERGSVSKSVTKESKDLSPNNKNPGITRFSVHAQSPETAFVTDLDTTGLVRNYQDRKSVV